MDNSIRISKTIVGEFYFTYAADDGRMIARSDSYATLPACKNCIRVFCHCKGAEQCESKDILWFEGKAVYEVFKEGDKYSFLLKGKYGEILVFGEMFDSAEERDAAIACARSHELDDTEEYEVII